MIGVGWRGMEERLLSPQEHWDFIPMKANLSGGNEMK
jgi:hypothetical protein